MQVEINDTILGDLKQLDITAPRHVEIAIRADRKAIWINIDGICVLRASRIDNLTIDNQHLDSQS